MSKKHIVISRDGGDFSFDLIFAGLVRRFGKENVIDYPPRDKHRQGKPTLVGDAEKDYGAERRSLCYVDGCEDLKRWTVDEIRTAFINDEIEYVWLDETLESYKYYIELFAANPKPTKVVLVAGHDSFRGDPLSVYQRFGPQLQAMFLDEWQPLYDKLPKAHVINFSCNFDHLWDVENRDKYLSDKQYDICFMGYNSNPIRRTVIEHIEKRWGHLNNNIIFETRPDTFDRFIRHDEMFKVMAQSRICLNVPGASTCGTSLRYYEIPYIGSCMLTMRFPAKVIKPFPGPEFSSLDELDMVIGNLFSDPLQIEYYAKLQHDHCMEYHTVDARTDYIFEILSAN